MFEAIQITELTIQVVELGISILTLIATIFISVKASGVSKKTNEISRNAIKPYLNIMVGDYNNKTYVKIRNSGLGTAIINDIKFVRENMNSDCIMKLAELYDSQLVNENYNTFVEDIKGRGIAPQEDIIILEKRYNKTVEDSQNNKTAENTLNKKGVIYFLVKNRKRKKLLEFLYKVEIEIMYEDIFGEKQELVYRKLDFFGRNLIKRTIENN